MIVFSIQVEIRVLMFIVFVSLFGGSSLTPTHFIEVPVHLCVRIIDVVSFYDFSIGYLKCSDSVVFYIFHFISVPVQLLCHYYQICCVMKVRAYITNLSGEPHPFFSLLVGIFKLQHQWRVTRPELIISGLMCRLQNNNIDLTSLFNSIKQHK